MKQAIQAARQAFDHGVWPALTLAQRGIYLKKIAEGIRKAAKELAEIESLDTGKTIKQSTFIDVPTCADTFDHFSRMSDKVLTKDLSIDAPVKGTLIREPYGVVAAIIPWNYPLIMAAWKIAPVIIAGNTVVFKPSSAASASILLLGKIIKESGLPDGVVNIVSSSHHDAAIALVADDNVDLVSFTGGGETGRLIMKEAAKKPKKVILELGGKSPNIVFADCDKEAAVGGTLSAIFMNQGQMCTAESRLYVEEKIYGEFLNLLKEKTSTFKIGDALDYQTSFGPLINNEHRMKVLEYIDKAVKQGAKLECGGKIPSQLKEGAYIEPTILSNVNPDMDIVKEEIFGPVLLVMKFSSEDEAVLQANNSDYGLAASIWTKDKIKAERVAKQLKCCTVWINTYGGFYNEAPYGGYKKSGFGRELGEEGFLEYMQTKHICIDETPGGKPLVSSWF
jgi:betaine-aldehyde dehydrogenase